jgi:8-oxo-dGTP pyrophosphatase MutT (NUDIX family)
VNDAYLIAGRLLYWVAWPGTWLYLRWSTRSRMLVVYGDEVLVVKNWMGDGRYHLPGGGLHPDELPAKGAVRELYEETGATLHEDEIVPLASEMYRHDGFRYKCHYFAYRSHTRLVTKQTQLEIADIAWVKSSDVSIYDHGPEVLRALELLDATN